MIDHLLRFSDRVEAGTVLETVGLAQQTDTDWFFSANVCLNIGGPDDESIRVGVQRSVWDFSDPENPIETQPEILIPGWYCIVSLDLLNTDIRDLPNNVCRLITDRDLANNGDPNFTLYTAPDLTQETINSVAFVEPTFSGSNYPFGSL